MFCSIVLSHSLAALWTEACKVPLSMEFSRQASWSGLPFPIPVLLESSKIIP